MRVTFVLPDANLGGGTRMIAQHADNLRRRGHDLFILSCPPWDIPLRSKFGALMKGKPWPSRPPRRPPSHLDGLDLDHKTLNRRRPVEDRDLPEADVVIATWWQTAEGVARLSPRKGAKVYFIQGSHFGPHFGPEGVEVASTWRLPMQKIVCASWLADVAREDFGDPTAIVVRNGLDLDLFDAPERGRQSHPTIGTVHGDHFCKGWDATLAAFSLVAERMPGIAMNVFGSSVPESLPPGVTFTHLPPQEAIPKIYASCDVYLCSSRNEGYGLPPIEAMGCRCPVVSTRVGAPAEVIQDGVNGFLVEIDDVEAMADRIVRVLNCSEPEWKRMSDAAYATAREFTVSDATDAFEQALYATVAKSRSQAVPAAGVH